ncbi:hypothetical protein B0H11DRAFT_2060132 [Mycena galericulata]|nr:hypothetical protein B0H11DRAFT_2060132 [Mycena galericulata]
MVRTLLNWVLPQLLFILLPASTPAPSRLPGVLQSPVHCRQHRRVPDTHPVISAFSPHAVSPSPPARFPCPQTVRGVQQTMLNSCAGGSHRLRSTSNVNANTDTNISPRTTPTLTPAPRPSPRRGTGWGPRCRGARGVESRLSLPLPYPRRAAPLHMGRRTT